MHFPSKMQLVSRLYFHSCYLLKTDNDRAATNAGVQLQHARGRQPSRSRCQPTIHGLGMGICVPGDHGVPRLFDRSGNRPSLRWHGEAQISTCYDLPVIVRHGHHLVPVDVLGVHAIVLKDWGPFYWGHEQFCNDECELLRSISGRQQCTDWFRHWRHHLGGLLSFLTSCSLSTSSCLLRAQR